MEEAWLLALHTLAKRYCAARHWSAGRNPLHVAGFQGYAPLQTVDSRET